jgi:hypothetical protein
MLSFKEIRYRHFFEFLLFIPQILFVAIISSSILAPRETQHLITLQVVFSSFVGVISAVYLSRLTIRSSFKVAISTFCFATLLAIIFPFSLAPLVAFLISFALSAEQNSANDFTAMMFLQSALRSGALLLLFLVFFLRQFFEQYRTEHEFCTFYEALFGSFPYILLLIYFFVFRVNIVGIFTNTNRGIFYPLVSGAAVGFVFGRFVLIFFPSVFYYGEQVFVFSAFSGILVGHLHSFYSNRIVSVFSLRMLISLAAYLAICWWMNFSGIWTIFLLGMATLEGIVISCAMRFVQNRPSKFLILLYLSYALGCCLCLVGFYLISLPALSFFFINVFGWLLASLLAIPLAFKA